MAAASNPGLPDVLALDPATVDNAVLRRLIAEIQAEGAAGARGYDRIHNRHNRGGGRPRPAPPRPPPPPPDEEERRD
jgi:hypothetical protein